jgi:hypothetical protein
VVALGRELADSLDPFDTLGRWMAHYIADLISRAETAENPDRVTLQRECSAEILRLWSHRHSFRNPDRPLASYEPLYRALDRLDPESPPWSFLRTFEQDTAPTTEQLEVNTLLKAAIAIEEAARDAVRELILNAVEVATQKEAKWLEAARKIQDDESTLIYTLRRLRRTDTDDASDEPASDQANNTPVQALETLSAASRTAREAVDLHQSK